MREDLQPFARLNATQTHVVCASPLCGARLAIVRLTKHGRMLQLGRAWSQGPTGSIWAVSTHSKPRHVPAWLLLRHFGGGMFPAYKYPTPSSYPARIRCRACGRIQILDGRRLRVVAVADEELPEPITPIQAFTHALGVAADLPPEPYHQTVQLARKLIQEDPQFWRRPPLSIITRVTLPGSRHRRRRPS